MWELDNTTIGSTNKVVATTEGLISITKPKGTKVSAYINDMPAPMHHVHVKPGDVVHFDLKNTTEMPTVVGFKYGDDVSYVHLPAAESTIYKDEEMTPAETVNLFANPGRGGDMGGALGGGLGAGLVGGLLGTMLFRNGGLNGVDNAVPATLAGVESVVSNTAIMQTLGDIKASVPLAEAQVQLALAGAQTAIIGDINTQAGAIIAGQNRDALANANNFSSLNTNLFTTATTTQKAVADASVLAERNAWAVTQAITNDGDRTRALIQSIDKSNDSRLITSQANEIVELRGDRRLQEATGNITISNTNTATAIQSQNQQQQQFQILANLNAQLGNLANDIQAVRQSSVVFNSGTQTGSGNQSAANTRVA